MTLAEILITLFFLVYLFLPKRPAVEKIKEFVSVSVFGVFFPFLMKPVWQYHPNAWSLFIRNIPVFIILYWIIIISLAVNISDRAVKKIEKKKNIKENKWLYLVSDIAVFMVLGIMGESLLYQIGSFAYMQGNGFGVLPVLNIPLIIPCGYIGLAFFGAPSFRFKKKACVP